MHTRGGLLGACARRGAVGAAARRALHLGGGARTAAAAARPRPLPPAQLPTAGTRAVRAISSAAASGGAGASEQQPPPAAPQHQHEQPQQRGPWPLLDERGAAFTPGAAFYRGESAQARDLAVLAAAVYKRRRGQLRVLDAMAGSGVRVGF